VCAHMLSIQLCVCVNECVRAKKERECVCAHMLSMQLCMCVNKCAHERKREYVCVHICYPYNC